jgi:hypothetical protein
MPNLRLLVVLALGCSASSAAVPTPVAPGPPPALSSVENADARSNASPPPTGNGAGPSAPPGPTTPIDAATLRTVVETLARQVKELYVSPNVASELERELLARLAAEKYASITHAEALAGTLTEDLRAIARDKHLRVMFMADAPPRPSPHFGPPLLPPHGGIPRVEILDGNIGYIALDSVPRLDDARPAIDAAFTLLAHTDGLIIDNRDNHGGDPNTVAYYMSYLLDGPPVVVNAFHWREGNRIEEFKTSDLGPKRYGGDRPVFVLTSAGTFSGGEELSYDLQAMRRAVLVGETTGGGANPARVIPIGFRFLAAIPFARAVNPITGTSWEGTGVVPDVAVPRERALDEARTRLAAQLEGTRPGPGRAVARRLAASPPPTANLLRNGDFSRGVAPWGVSAWKDKGVNAPHPHRLEQGVLCFDVLPEQAVLIGWPSDSSSAAPLLARRHYQLSFRASASGSLPVRASANVGRSRPPYLRAAVADIPLEEPFAYFAFDVVPAVAEPQSGVAFWVTAEGPTGTSHVCLADVVLAEMPASSRPEKR